MINTPVFAAGHRLCLGAVALALSFGVAAADARAADRYPDFGGAWARTTRGGMTAQWDTTKPPGLGQEALLTPEYQAVFEANLASRRAGGQEFNPAINCMPAGMPRVMVLYDPIEIIITPEVTYIRTDHLPEMRRIYTDGRDWPRSIPATFAGYSIGRWMGEDAEGRYQTLEIESRGMRGPRVLDVDGLPLHRDNLTVVKEHLVLDKDNSNLLHNEITVIDHAFTRPWTTARVYRREPRPMWVENNCMVDNHYVSIGPETYFLSADGYLMPAKKDQAPPDLRYFDQARR